MLTLRPYQLDLVASIWEEMFKENNVLVTLPTGTGKTECFIELCRKSIEKMPSIKILIILNRVLLVEQTARRIRKVIPSCGIFCGSLDEKEINQVTVASVQSVYKHDLGKINMVILDEAHHLSEDDDSHYRKLLKTLNHDKLKVIGFTATPYRSDGKIYGPDKLFKRLTYQKSIPSMIEDGYLVKPLMKKVEHQFDTSQLRIRMGEFKQEDVEKLTSDYKKLKDQVTDALSRCKDRKKVVWACASIEHCENVCKEIESRGEIAVTVHSKNKDSDRNKQMFENGSVKHLVFVTIVSEGYDFPPIDCVVLMRPIRSPVLYVQTVGRGIRPADGKKDCLVLDYGKVVETLGPLDKPLISEGRIKKSDRPIPMRVCPDCFEYCRYGIDYCPTCEFQFVKKETNPTKNLERKSSFASLISTQPVEQKFDVNWVELSKHRSKNGNECLRIIYNSNDILGSSISEYFVFNNPWAYKRMQQRLMQLECELKPTLNEQAQVKPCRCPNEIVFVVEDGFKKIKRLNFLC